jgi:WXG100 family type VII secretion target
VTLIQIDTEQVAQTGTQFNSTRNQVEELVNRANSMMTSLEGQFKGARAERIFADWREMMPRLQAGVQSLEMAGALLSRASADFFQVDSA